MHQGSILHENLDEYELLHREHLNVLMFSHCFLLKQLLNQTL